MAKKEFDLTPDYTNENPQTESNSGNVPSAGNDGAEVPSAGNQEEADKDPNNIKVTINDPAPIIILFGPGSSGKTMTLVRLTRWLEKNEYQVIPDVSFRASDAKKYKEACQLFQKLVHSDYAAKETNIVDFIMLMVKNKYGEPICQILEAPGEHYFYLDDPQKPFPSYINVICNSKNPKTWVFIVEKDWKETQNKLDYARKICQMQSKISRKDRVIFTCHKADLHSDMINGTIPNTKQFLKDIKNQYPGIFSRYENQNPLTSLFNTRNFDFVVFSAGDFSTIAGSNNIKYDAGPDKYPAELWQAILKTVKGGW